MKACIYTHKIEGKWWTYTVVVNGRGYNKKPFIYRMYSKEKTALNNGIKLLQKHLTKTPSK